MGGGINDKKKIHDTTVNNNKLPKSTREKLRDMRATCDE